MDEITQKNIVIAGTATGGGLMAAQSIASTKYGKNIKSSLSNSIKSSAIMQSIKSSKIVNKISNAVTALQATKTATTASKALSKVAGPGVAAVASSVTAGMSISQTTQSKYMTEEEKAVSITGDVLGIAANVAVALVGGPIGLVIALLAMLGGLLDQFVNPFKNYFNKDLREMRGAYYDAAKKSFIDMGYNWPLEVKPDLLGTFGDPETIKEYQKYLKEYYDEKGLITEEQFLEEHQILMDLRKLRRFRKKFIVNEQGDPINVRNVSLKTISMLEESQNNIEEIEADSQRSLLLVFAIIAYTKKLQKEKPSFIYQYLQVNYISVIISSISLILIIFLSIYSIS